MLMFQKLRHSILEQIVAPSRLSLDNVMAMLSPGGRSQTLRRHIAAIIVARVQLIAALFAILVPLGAVADFIAFDIGIALRMGALRLASSALFVALAWPRELSPSAPYRQAMAGLLALLMIPSLFNLLSVDLLASTPLAGGALMLARLYGYLPTVVLCGLAIFPLTALEACLLALPALATAGLAFASKDAGFSLSEHGPAIWFMAMTLSVAVFSGMSQCHYMSALVNRASLDTLTGAYTRRSGEDAMGLIHRLTGLSGKPFSVLFFDLDHFKAVNDQYGHEAGDEALRDFAGSLLRGLRGSDVLIRWGGEEFVVAMPDTPSANLLPTLQRLRAKGFGRRPDGSPLTASIGAASTDEGGGDAWQEIVARADKRMYAAKQAGRDRAALAGDKVETFA